MLGSSATLAVATDCILKTRYDEILDGPCFHVPIDELRKYLFDLVGVRIAECRHDESIPLRELDSSPNRLAYSTASDGRSASKRPR